MRETSLLAWFSEEESLSEMESVVLAGLRAYGSCTHNELAYKMADGGILLPNHKENVRKRCAELHKKGLVIENGERECLVTHRIANTWRAR